MTTNQPIDGVPRELLIPIEITAHHTEDLLRFFDTCEDDQGYDVPKPRMKSLARVGLIRSTGFSRYEITDLGYSAVEILCKPAAQPQGEPVAWRVTGRGGLTVTPEYPKWAVGERGLTTTPLYAEQPATVAVVMPEDWQDQLFAEMERRFELRKQIDGEHMVNDDTQIGVEFARDWIAERLNTK